MTARTDVDIGICTYRRAAVTETLASLAKQELPPGVHIRIVVADNDESPTAKPRVLEAAAKHGLDVVYAHAPARNISLARNACLDAARGDFVAFLDDDETASPGWLAALLAEADRAQWDVVLGPVKALYAADAPGWLASGDFHSTTAVAVGGMISKGYAGNALIRRSTIEARNLRFDLARGRTGGEDDDFFYRLTDTGGRIGFAPQAWAYEPVPPARTSLRWLLRRSFRTGQTHGVRLASRHHGASRLAQIGIAGAKSGACLVGAAAFALSPLGRNRWLLRGSLHAGVVARMAGLGELQLY